MAGGRGDGRRRRRRGTDRLRHGRDGARPYDPAPLGEGQAAIVSHPILGYIENPTVESLI